MVFVFVQGKWRGPWPRPGVFSLFPWEMSAEGPLALAASGIRGLECSPKGHSHRGRPGAAGIWLANRLSPLLQPPSPEASGCSEKQAGTSRESKNCRSALAIAPLRRLAPSLPLPRAFLEAPGSLGGGRDESEWYKPLAASLPQPRISVSGAQPGRTAQAPLLLEN